MTVLLWITGISVLVNLLVRYINRRDPQRAGADYAGLVLQVLSTIVTGVLLIACAFTYI